MNENVEAYPLSWPVGVPRTPSHNRGRAKFGRTDTSGAYASKKPIEFGGALSRLRAQLNTLGARNVVVSSNVPTRGDGMPYARSSAPEDPGVAVYFTLEGQPTCLPCDKWSRIADNVAAIAKHIDAMRGMSRWGVGSIAQLFAGFKALPPRGGSTVGEEGAPWWQVLGVPRLASLGEIDSRYRELAMKHHPDRGGDAGAFAAITRARDQGRATLGG